MLRMGNCYSGPHSHALTGWAAKGQGSTGRSTGDSESTAIADMIAATAESTRTCWEELLGRDVWLIARSDADVAIGAIKKGYSR